MKNFKRLFAILCAVSLVLSVAGCGKTGGTASGDTEDEGGKKINTTIDGDSGNNNFNFERYEPYSKDDVVDLKGYEFVIASVFLQNELGGIVTAQDTAFENARRQTEALLNCKITVKNMETTVSSLQQQMMAGEKVADLLDITPTNLIPAYEAGYIRAMEYIDGIDYNDKRWVKSVTNLGVYDDLHLFLNFIRPQEVRVCMFVNNGVLKESGINEDLFSLVKNKKWTFDKFREICKKVTKDTDGDGEVDRTGLVMSYAPDCGVYFAIANNAPMLVKNSEGKYVENITNKDFLYGFEFLNTLVNVDKTTYIFDFMRTSSVTSQVPERTDIFNMFCRNKVAFWLTESWAGNKFLVNNTVDLDYSILPMPMGPNATEYTSSSAHTRAFAFTTTNKDIDKSVIVFNTMARILSESGDGDNWWKEDIKRDYFTKNQDKNLEIYELILESSTIDYGTVVPDFLSHVSNNMVGKAIYLNQGTPASQAESLSGVFTDTINSMLNE
ncbi:MAG: extracellular solute-binding protein [Clostridia bacterium]|nr:extracellular solute-binding protein [Clostridia bacterium]